MKRERVWQYICEGCDLECVTPEERTEFPMHVSRYGPPRQREWQERAKITETECIEARQREEASQQVAEVEAQRLRALTLQAFASDSVVMALLRLPDQEDSLNDLYHERLDHAAERVGTSVERLTGDSSYWSSKLLEDSLAAARAVWCGR